MPASSSTMTPHVNDDANDDTTVAAQQNHPYHVSLSPRFAISALLFSTATCFALGCWARRALLLHQQQQQDQGQSASFPLVQSLPPLFVAPHKSIPHTRYTSKHYDTGLSVGSDTLVSHYKPTTNGAVQESATSTANVNATHNDDEEEEIHEPAGQHLLIDMEHVDGAFLNSEHHLAQTMIDLVDRSGLTMLSYHCHKLLPAGISCAGVLLESHVSFHTWPVQGVITLDLFTCGPNSLLNLLGDVESLFAIPDSTKQEKPKMIWAFKRRGFPTDEGYTPGISDLGTTLLGVLQFPRKEQLSFFQTPYQQVHIYNVLDPRYSNDTMERRMYLDGVLQARQRGQAAYAEAFIHPALLTHSNPQKITIIGGGDGATLREVLKHSSVEQVEWMEIDQAVAEVSQEWLWSQCDDFLPAVSSCRDDPRVNSYYEDGFEWFQKRYGGGAASSEEQHHHPKQHVIILDVMNPEDEVDFSEVLYDDFNFALVLHDALEDDGILAVKLGQGPSMQNPPEQWTRAHHVAKLVSNLEQVGFTTIHEYEDSHGGMLESDTSSFLVAFKGGAQEEEWFANEAQVEVKLQERLVRSKDGQLPLTYFDGATMQSYQMPSRATEVMFCKNQRAKNGRKSDCENGLDAVLATEDALKDLDLEMEVCLSESRIPGPSFSMLKEHVSPLIAVSHIAVDDYPEGYNPFIVRNAGTNACARGLSEHLESPQQSQRQLHPPALEMTLDSPTPNLATENVVDAEGVELGKASAEEAIASCDSHRPNYTAASSREDCSDNPRQEGECDAATTAAHTVHESVAV